MDLSIYTMMYYTQIHIEVLIFTNELLINKLLIIT
jgi:hypothetical protein